MASTISRQICALIWRYIITLLRSYIASTFRIFVEPGLVLGVSFHLMNNSRNIFDNKDTKLEFAPFIPWIIYLVTAIHFLHFTNFLIADRSTKFKSLMTSMGLGRTSYTLAHTLASLGYLLPISIITLVISLNYALEETRANIILIVLLFIMFAIHLTAVTHVFSALIPSTSYSSLLYIILVAELALNAGVQWLLKYFGEKYYSHVMFFASFSPYESIRIFFSGYTLCKNCPNTLFDSREMNQPIELILLAMTTWTVLAYLFAHWFEDVCPWKTDTAVKSAFYCFHCKSDVRDSDEDEESSRGSKYFERVTGQRDIGIRIYKLTKTFNKVPAVSDVTFNIYKGETTLLLGHNGAGKTTMMSMILGQLQQDYGLVSIRHGGVVGRRSVGLCPQESILDDNLTVKQHVRLFADIKSSEMSGTELEDHIKATISDVSLANHEKKVVSELSGGMKRKLSLALAFVAKSNVLILDEPSSGLDPDSRVHIWNAIRRYRGDRTVLLSTQHMEEADYLGDRIAIMSGGRIICCGSSSFLNKVYGSGYKLRIECHASRHEQILSFVHKYFENAHMSDQEQMASLSSQSTAKDPVVDLVFELTEDRSKDSEWNLIKLLEDMEANSKALHIKSFGLKSSSIEDVMLNTSRGSAQSGYQSIDMNPINSNLATLNSAQKSVKGKVSGGTYLLWALLVKHFDVYRNDWFSIICNRVVGSALGAYLLAGSITSGVNGLDYTSHPGVTLIFMHLVYYPTSERASKFKTVQLMSAASVELYWIAFLLSELLSIILWVISLDYFIYYLTRPDFYVITDAFFLYSVAAIALVMAAVSAALLAYILSTALSSSRSAVGYYFLMFSIYPITYIVLKAIAPPLGNPAYLNFIIDTLKTIFIAMSPVETLQYIGHGFTSKCYIEFVFRYQPNVLPDCRVKEGSPFLYGFLALSAQIVVYASLLLIIEHSNFDLAYYLRWRNWPCVPARAANKGGPIQMKREIAQDQDVIDESAKARALTKSSHVIPGETYSVVASDVSKSYIKGIKAVDGLSLTVNRGECFGLLGVNGAGKSTTFSMLAGETRPDSGVIWIDGKFSKDELDEYRRYLGYDPQSNPDMSLTSHQALRLMARLRQLDDAVIDRSIKASLVLLNMSEHAHKKCCNLSGGTKRKLGLAMSLLGGPSVLLLDEPTAGIDPIARRSVWLLLRTLRLQSNASIVISSHAMEECEAVCDRISIMARGRLRCVGTFLRLRSKFSQGCSIRVQFGGEQAPDRVKRLISELGQQLQAQVGESVRLTDSNFNSATFNVRDDSVRRSALFKILREFRRKHEQVSYMLNDSSLEDIFIALAREQQEHEAFSPEQRV